MSNIKGIVRKFFSDKGFGFITAEDGRDVFIHSRDIEGGKKELHPGDKLEFQIVETEKGWAARNAIFILDEAASIIKSTRGKNNLTLQQTDVVYQEALAAKDRGDITRARLLFDQAIENTSNPYVYLSYAAMEDTARRGDVSLRILQQGIRNLSSDGILYEHYAMKLRRRGDLKGASEILRQGLKKAPAFAKQMHWSLAVVLADINEENSLKEAITHAMKAKDMGMGWDTMPSETRNKLNLMSGPVIGQEALDFFITAGFDVRVEEINDNYADFLVVSKQIEYTESYDLQGRILARCFFKKEDWKDIQRILSDMRKPPRRYKGLNFNNEIAFMIADNAHQWRDALYRVIEDNREAIIPIDHTVFMQTQTRETVNNLTSILDQWLSRRDLFHYRFPVSGRQFYGRESELQNIMRNIDDGQHTGLYGLRKVGKTSLMYQIQEKRPQDIVIYADLQKIAGISKDCSYLYWDLSRSLQEELNEKYEARIINKKVNLKLGAEDDYEKIADPQEKNALRFSKDIKDALASIIEIDPSSKIVITIDELEWMLPAPGFSPGFKQYAEFFAHIRGIAQDTYGKLVTVITAANPLVSEQGKWDGRDNPVFQFYKDMFLPPLSQEECNEMIKKLGRGMGVSFNKGSLELIYTEAGGHPYITRQLCSHIVHQNPSRPLNVNSKLVSESIDSFIRNKGDIFEEILDRLDFFPIEKELFTFIADGLDDEKELQSLVDKPIDIALRHLIGYQIVDYKKGKYYIKINLLYRWMRRFRLGYKE